MTRGPSATESHLSNLPLEEIVVAVIQSTVLGILHATPSLAAQLWLSGKRGIDPGEILFTANRVR